MHTKQSIWYITKHTYHTSHLPTHEQRLHTLLTLSGSRPLCLFLPWEHHLPISCHWKTPQNCKVPWHAHVRCVSSVEDDSNYYLQENPRVSLKQRASKQQTALEDNSIVEGREMQTQLKMRQRFPSL